MKKQPATWLPTAALASTAAYAGESKTKYGITVTECRFDYDSENFCTDSRMKTFAKVTPRKQGGILFPLSREKRRLCRLRMV